MTRVRAASTVVPASAWLALVSVAVGAAQTGNRTFIPASSAALSIGKTTVVCGVVGAVRTTKDADEVDLDGEAPNQALTVIVQANKRFDAATRARAAGLQVCAGGTIERDRRGVVIKIKDLAALRAVPGPIDRPSDFPGPGVFDLTGGRKVPGVTDPRPRTQAEPKYTALAMGAGINGNVEMEAVVRADGTVAPIRVMRSLDALYGLDAEAVAAASRWTFTPSMQNGQPVPVIVTIVMTFRLHTSPRRQARHRALPSRRRQSL